MASDLHSGSDVSWADGAIVLLKKGREAWITPHGNSMTPRIKSGERVLVKPADPTVLKEGDVVLVKVRGVVYLHLIKRISRREGLFLIGNNKGGTNGWVDGSYIYGKAEK